MQQKHRARAEGAGTGAGAPSSGNFRMLVAGLAGTAVLLAACSNGNSGTVLGASPSSSFRPQVPVGIASPTGGPAAAAGGGKGTVLANCGTTAEQLGQIFGMPMANDYTAEMVANLSHNGGIPNLYKQARYAADGMVEVVPQSSAPGGGDPVSDRCSWTAQASGQPAVTVELSADRGPATMSHDAVLSALQDQLGKPLVSYSAPVAGFDWRYACTEEPTLQGSGGACVAEAFRVQGGQVTEVQVWVHNYGDYDSAPEMLTDKAMSITVRNALEQL